MIAWQRQVAIDCPSLACTAPGNARLYPLPRAQCAPPCARVSKHVRCAGAGNSVRKLTVSADAQPHSVVFTAARAAMVDRSVPRRYAGAMLKPYLAYKMHLGFG